MTNNKPTGRNSLTRRDFMGRAAAAAAGLMVVPRHVLGGIAYTAPSDRINIGCVGVWGKGASDIRSIATENIVALCDVDDTMIAKFLSWDQHTPEERAVFEKAARYRDFRVMLDKHPEIDAVTVSTPDHTHAVIALRAMRMSKHVFVQKPLTHTIEEARLMAETARETGVVTQMGNQGHAGEGGRLINEWIWDGAIGRIGEVHCWTNRPIWPQGIEAPEEIPSVPSTLDWDLWIGPAPFRPYHPAYHPFSWRGWWDFGTGALGDMGAHILDHPFWALKLGSPISVQASSTLFTKDSPPAAEMVTYEFPAREDMAPVTLTWYDGGLAPPRPKELEDGLMMGDEGGGGLFVGEKGKLMFSTYGRHPRLLPESLMKAYTRPEKSIPRSPGIHEEWIAAIKAGKKSSTDFSYSGPLTEVMLLANAAVRAAEHKTKLMWNADAMTFTNLPEADKFLRMDYRPGWSLK